MSIVKTFFAFPTPFSFFDCSILFPHRLVPLPVSIFSQQISHSSSIPNILDSPRQSRLQLHSFMKLPRLASIKGHSWHMPGLGEFSLSQGQISQPPSSVLNSGTTCLKLSRSTAYWEWNMAHCSITSSPAFFPSLFKLGCLETGSLDQTGLKLRIH